MRTRGDDLRPITATTTYGDTQNLPSVLILCSWNILALHQRSHSPHVNLPWPRGWKSRVALLWVCLCTCQNGFNCIPLHLHAYRKRLISLASIIEGKQESIESWINKHAPWPEFNSALASRDVLQNRLMQTVQTWGGRGSLCCFYSSAAEGRRWKSPFDWKLRRILDEDQEHSLGGLKSPIREAGGSYAALWLTLGVFEDQKLQT